MAYLLDANVFIQAQNLHYGFDFCPGFWEWLRREHDRGHVFSINRVRDELEPFDDELTEWAHGMPDTFFKTQEPALSAALGQVSAWAASNGYEPTAQNTFYQAADFYLVAHALHLNFTVVTHEVFAATPKKVKIPNACMGLGVEYVTTFEMLRRERARFVLSGE